MRDLTGQRFGRLVAIETFGRNKYGNVLWLCKCDCGNTHIVPSGKLVQRKSKSCGCYAKEVHTKSLEKHGITTGGRPRTLTIWCGMKARCLDPKAISYKSYGARGITVCEEWLGKHGFENFHNWAMANGYSDDLTIDRIDNNGNYEPGNCRWATRLEQSNNTRRNRHYSYKGETHTLSEWGRTTGLKASTIYARIIRGWSFEDAITLSLKKNQFSEV